MIIKEVFQELMQTFSNSATSLFHMETHLHNLKSKHTDETEVLA